MKHIVLSAALLLILSFCFTSCYTTRYANKSLQPEYADSLVGKTQKQVLQMLNPPNRIISDGEGGAVYCYENEVAVTNTAVTPGYYADGLVTATHMQLNYIYVFLNSQGIVYDVNTNHCELIPDGKCFNHETSWVPALIMYVVPPVGVVATVVTAIVYGVAKSKGNVCGE